jgi:large subunit ribosomal protein L17
MGRAPAHRRQTLRGLVTNLLERERITTTLPKAKALRPLAEKMITLGKRDTLHARRQAAAFLVRPPVVKKLFADLAPRFGDRNGGYTRIVRGGWRRGDGGEVAIVELIGSELKPKAPKKKKEAPAESEAQPEK